MMGSLRPGILMNVDIILEEINEAVLIPEKSVLTAKILVMFLLWKRT